MCRSSLLQWSKTLWELEAQEQTALIVAECKAEKIMQYVELSRPLHSSEGPRHEDAVLAAKAS